MFTAFQLPSCCLKAIGWITTRENKGLSGPGQWPKTSTARFREWDSRLQPCSHAGHMAWSGHSPAAPQQVLVQQPIQPHSEPSWGPSMFQGSLLRSASSMPPYRMCMQLSSGAHLLPGHSLPIRSIRPQDKHTDCRRGTSVIVIAQPLLVF